MSAHNVIGHWREQHGVRLLFVPCPECQNEASWAVIWPDDLKDRCKSLFCPNWGCHALLHVRAPTDRDGPPAP